MDRLCGFETNGAKDDDDDNDDDDDDTTSHGAVDDGGLFIHRHASVTTRVRKHTVRSFVRSYARVVRSSSGSPLSLSGSLIHPSIHPSISVVDRLSSFRGLISRRRRFTEDDWEHAWGVRDDDHDDGDDDDDDDDSRNQERKPLAGKV